MAIATDNTGEPVTEFALLTMVQWLQGTIPVQMQEVLRVQETTITEEVELQVTIPDLPEAIKVLPGGVIQLLQQIQGEQRLPVIHDHLSQAPAIEQRAAETRVGTQVGQPEDPLHPTEAPEQAPDPQDQVVQRSDPDQVAEALGPPEVSPPDPAQGALEVRVVVQEVLADPVAPVAEEAVTRV